MCTLAGPEATIYFASLSTSSATTLTADLEAGNPCGRLGADFHATHVGVKDIMVECRVPIEKVCLLDPKAEKELSPEDGDGRFDWFLFGVSIPIGYPPLQPPDFYSFMIAGNSWLDDTCIRLELCLTWSLLLPYQR